MGRGASKTQSLNIALGLRFKVAEGITLFAYFLVIPDLSETVILGTSLFRNYKCNINFERNAIRMHLPNGKKVSIPGYKNTQVYERSNILADRNTLNLISEKNRSESHLDTRVKILVLNDHLASVRSRLVDEIDRAKTEEIITTEMGEWACNILVPLCEVFNPSAGTYKWDQTSFKILPTQQWKARKYHYPLAYQIPLRQKIKEMLETGIIKVMRIRHMYIR